MPTIDQIRQRFPSAKNLTDGQIIDKLSSLTQTPYEEVAGRLGFYEDSPRGVLGAANDYVIEAANSAAGFVGSIGNMIAPGNRVSQFIDNEIIKPGEASQSVPVQLAKRKLGRALSSDDLGTQAGGVLDYVTENPMLAASQAAGSFAPMGIGLKATQLGARALGAGARGAETAGLGAGAVMSGAASGGDAAGSAYELVKQTPWESLSQHPQAQELLAQNLSPEAVYEELATRAARRASLVPAAIGAVAGATGAEKALLGGVRGLRGAAKTVAKEFGGEFLEESATQYSGQSEAAAYNPEINPMAGVAGAGLLGGIMGAGIATPIALANMRGEARTADQPQYDLTKDDSAAEQQEPALLGLPYYPPRPRQLGYTGSLQSEPLLSFPDGTVTMDEAQELQARFPNAAGVVRPAERVEPDRLLPSPAVSVDGLGTAATNYTDLQALQDPGAILARQQYEQKQQELQEAQRIEQEKRAELTSLNEELGINSQQYKQQHALLKQLKGLREAGAITPEQYTEQVALLRGDKPLDIKSARAFVKDVEKTQAAQQANAAAAQAAAPAAPAPVRSAPPAAQATTTQEAASALLVDGKTPAPAPAVTPVSTTEAPAEGRQRAMGGEGNIVDRTKKRLADLGVRVVKGMDIDFAALKDVLEGLDPRWHHAVRLTLGVDKDGDKLDRPLSQQQAVQKAGIGSSHSSLSKILSTLGLTPAVRRRFVSSNAQATERAEGDIEPARSDIAEELNQYVEDEAVGSEGGPANSDDADSSQTAESISREAGRSESTGKTQGADEGERRGSVVNQPWYKQMVEAGGLAQASDQQIAKAGVLAQRFKDSPENRAAVTAIMVEVEQRSRDPEFRRLLTRTFDKYSGDVATKEAASEEVDGGGSDSARPGQDSSSVPGSVSRGGADVRGDDRGEADAGSAGQAKTPVVVTKKRRTLAKPVNAREMRVLGKSRIQDPDGTIFEVEEVSRDEFLASPGIATALSNLRRSGVDSMVDQVEVFYVTGDPNADFEGLYAVIDGKRAMVIHANELASPKQAAFTFSHEAAHAADQTHTGGPGRYSSHRLMAVSVTGDRVVATGDVAAEVLDFYNANPDSDLAGVLAYALDRTRNPQFNARDVQQELFAQLAAAYNMPNGRMLVMQNLPLTTQFLEAVYAHIQKTQQSRANRAVRQGAAGGQGQAASQGQGTQPGQLRPGSLQNGRASGQGNSAAAVTAGRGTVQKNIAKLPQGAQAPVRNTLNAIGDLANKSLDYVVFTGDLVKRAVAAGMASAKTFEQLLVQRAELARTNEEAAQQVADLYASVPEQDRGRGERSVNSFLFESTRTGKWGYGKDADPEMRQWFESLQPATQAFVKAVFAHGDKVLADKKAAVLKFTASEYDARIAAEADAKIKGELENDKKALLKRFSTLFAIREGKPYAPIKRTGDYVVIGKSQEYLDAEEAADTKRMAELEKDEAHYQVSFTQGKTEARRMAAALAADGRYPADGVYLRQRDKHQDSLYGGDGVLKSLAKLRSRVENSEDPTSAKMMRMVSDLYLEALAEDSARKSEMRRRGIAGEVDMLASFAQQGKADANFMASVQYTQPIQDSIRAMTQEMKRARDDGRASEIRNELLARYEQVLDRKDTPLLDKATRLSSIWFLATSPGYYMQNLTQPFMMSIPAMAGRHNYLAAVGALTNAYGELKDIVNSGLVVRQQFDLSKVPTDVREAIDELTKRGKIDIGMDSDMGEFQVEGEGKAKNQINKTNNGLRHAVQKIETINRLSTAMAAYRLELAKTGDKTKALEYADQVLTETHGDYTAFNAPRVFNTPLGKVSLQFRKFQLIQLSYYAKLLNDAFSNPVERKAALRTLAYSVGHLAMFAGVRGLPGFAAASWLLGKLLGDQDEPYDVEQKIRNAIGDPTLANIVMRGTPTLAGMDLSGKIGAGNALSIMPFSNADLTTAAGRNQAVGELLLGAVGGMSTRFLDGVGLMASGDWYRGLEQTMPKGISDALKAYREGTEGMTRRNGDLLLSPEELSFAGTLWGSLGLPSSQKAVVYEQQQRTRAVDQKFQDRSTKIKNDYAKAVRERNADDMAAAREAWNKLQEARVRNGYTKQPLSALLKAPQQQLKRERETDGGVQYNRSNRAFVESQV